MTVRTLHLYGELADRYGPKHDVAASTIGDAVRIVDCNQPGFANAIRRKHFHVACGNGRLAYKKANGSVYRARSKAVELLPHQLPVPRGGGDWHLVPAMQGSKGRGFKTVFSIVVGGALLATGIGGAAFGAFGATGGLGTAATFATSTGFLGLSYGTVALMGASLFLGGINMLLSPTPQTNTKEKKPTAFSFDGPGEVDDEGGPIPIWLGEVVGGAVRIAASIESGTAVAPSSEGVGGAGGKFSPDGPWGAVFNAVVDQR